MKQSKNFFSRALDALVGGRQREAKRFVERFEREHDYMNSKFTKH